MKKNALLATSVCLLLALPAYAVKVGGIEVPETLTTGGAALTHNGSGTRTKFGFTMYVGSLYLAKKSSDAGAILASGEGMAVRLQITSSMITPSRMEEAIREGIANATGGQAATVQKEVDAFIKVFGNGIKPGDVFEFVSGAQQGVEVRKNGVASATIAGDAFRKALFGIWLCGKPAQESLKKGMLGL